MNQDDKDRNGSGHWKRTLAIMLVLLMVAMVASPIFAVGEVEEPLSDTEILSPIPFENQPIEMNYLGPLGPSGGSNPSEVDFDIGPYDHTYSSDRTRGYWFTAPCDFRITALRVPTDVGTDIQNIEVIRLNGAPPAFPTTTNSFNSLGYWNFMGGDGWITCSINVHTGEIIGILGARGTTEMHNPYGATDTYDTDIFGNPCTLRRLGFQDILHSTQAYDVWTEDYTYSLVEMKYDTIGPPSSILVYADDAFHTAPNTYIDQALNSLGYPYTAHYDGDFAGFENSLKNGGPWDLVIYGGENYGPPDSPFDAMNNYAIGGGQLICGDWDIADRPGHPLWDNMGFTYQSWYGAPPPPVYWWDPGHQFFNNPESVPELTVLGDPGYGTYGHRVEPLPGFSAPAGYTTPGPDPNEAAIIYGNYGRTIYKTFLDGQNDADLDGDGVSDGVELWINMISNFGPITHPDPLRVYWYDDYEEEVYDGSIREFLESQGHTVTYQEDSVGIWPDAAALIPTYDVIVAEHTCGDETIINLDQWFTAGKGYVALFGDDMYNDPPQDDYIMNLMGVGPNGGYNNGAWGPGDLSWVDPSHPIATYPNYGWPITGIPDGQDQFLVDITGGNDVVECPSGPVLQTMENVEGAGRIAVMGSNYHNNDRTDPETRKLVENMLYWTYIPPPDYWFVPTPATQTRFGWTGDWVDHYITIQNTGLVRDNYLPMFHNNNWWTKFHWVDVDIVTGEKSKGEQTWWVGPVDPGDSIEFIASVFVPGVTFGDFDRADITITSHGDGAVVQTIEIITTTSLQMPYYNDFESGVFGVGVTPGNDWTTDYPNRAGVNDMTACPPSTYSMYTRWGPVSITSCMMHMGDIPVGIVSCWIQRGDNAFSESPDGGEDLVIEYQREWVDEWVQLDSFPGAGTPGEIFTPVYVLPENALHPRFQLRFRQLDGSGSDNDYWHIDNVYIGPPTSNFVMTPDTITQANVLPGEILQYDMTITNNALHSDLYEITVTGNNWPTSTHSPIFSDDFEDGDYTDWTVVDEGTSSAPSNWWVDGSGELRQTANIHTWDAPEWSGTYLYHNNGFGWTDYLFSGRFRPVDNDGVGMMFRYTDNDNYYRFRWNRNYDFEPTIPGTQWRVFDVVKDGIWQTLWYDAVPDANTWYDFEVKCLGDRLVTYIDGVEIVDIIDDSHSQGTVALYVWGQDNTYFDDIEVYHSGNPVGPVPPGGSMDFITVVEVPENAQPGDFDVANIVATSLDTTVTDTTQITTSIRTVHNIDQDTLYNTIQDGVNDANPGETLMVYPRTYNENVVIDRPLTVIGVDRSTTIIDGGGAGNVVTITSDDVYFNGFTVQHSGTGAGDAALFLDGVHNCNIFDNTFIDSWDGISLYHSGANSIYDNGIGTDPWGSASGFLETMFATNNNYAGNMFDVEAKKPLTIISIDVNVNNPGAGVTFELYYRPGTFTNRPILLHLRDTQTV
jgi:parallel beta-helix repeat protein